jgi:mono/diheme cytochrome c family protein
MRSALALLLLVAACDQRMSSQPKYHEYEPAALFRNGRVLQNPPAETVARGELADREAAVNRPALSLALLRRGRERFDIFCAPCHGRTGDGDGMIVQRGMPQPPSYHIDRLRAAPDKHFVRVVTEGYGAMYSYSTRVPPEDRWAIVAYIRALQHSRHASLDELPPEIRVRLRAEPSK